MLPSSSFWSRHAVRSDSSSCACGFRRAGSRAVEMADRNLTERVEVLEVKMASLEELPARVTAVESQIVQLRTEMRGEFSAVRQEMRALNDETRAEIRET